MPQVSNVKLALVKETAKPETISGWGSGWAGSLHGTWKATVSCEIALDSEGAAHEVIIALYGIAEGFLGGPTNSWVPVHRFFWSASGSNYSGSSDSATIYHSDKNFSRYNYVDSSALDVNKAIATSLGPGSPIQIILRPEKIFAHVFVRAEGSGAASDPQQISA